MVPNALLASFVTLQIPVLHLLPKLSLVLICGSVSLHHQFIVPPLVAQTLISGTVALRVPNTISEAPVPPQLAAGIVNEAVLAYPAPAFFIIIAFNVYFFLY